MASASQDTPIGHVTDTAVWVAHYRAVESARPDALFHDPLAEKLVGTRGSEIESRMSSSMYVQWSLVMRTVIIDDFLIRAISEGADTIVNLGCGLDTRPYRMNLPKDLNWVEVDFPQMIEYKTNVLKSESPRCRLERIGADLSDRKTRQEVLAQIAGRCKKAMVITEGVILYLSEENVNELSSDLKSHPQFQYWVTERLHPWMKKYMTGKKRESEMRNAPFLFWPEDWMGFFTARGWRELESQYVDELSLKLKRPLPMPKWLKLIFSIIPFNPKPRRYVGYVLWVP